MDPAAWRAIRSDPRLGRLWDVLPEARLVGGAVRDLLAGRPVVDLDLATPDRPDRVVRSLADAGIKTVPTGIAHGTVTAVIERQPFEITTLRRDVATDGRRAAVAWTDDWREDASRRDFTINAMSLDRDGVLGDWFEGAADLAAGRVRFVGDAGCRIEEDNLRILRFFRFFARYGRAPADQAALDAIAQRAGLVASLSAERVWSETRRILTGPSAGAVVGLMERLGVLVQIVPEGASVARLVRLEALSPPADPVLAMAALSRGEPVALAARLRMSGDERRRLAGFHAGAVPEPPVGDDRLLALLADEDRDLIAGRTWLAEIDGRPGTHPEWMAVRERLAGLDRPVFPLAGRDAVSLGVAAGPRIGEALSRTRRWWLSEGTHPDRTACRKRLAVELGLAPPAGADFPGPDRP